MVQWAKVHDTKADDLSSIGQDPMVEEGNQL